MKLRLKRQNSRVCLTLIELIIVVIIIGILVGVVIPQYRKSVIKAKASKAQYAVALVAKAASIYQLNNDVYIQVNDGAVEATIGTAVTGINLAAVDNDTDFNYSATVGGLITGTPKDDIGPCGVGDVITLDLPTGLWDIPSCWN